MSRSFVVIIFTVSFFTSLFVTNVCKSDELESKSVILEKDIVYSRHGLLLDVMRPAKPKSDFLPIVVWIHGGGWEKGSKESGWERLKNIVSSGRYVGIAINYRLTDIAHWPAQKIDVVDAINWIFKFGRMYGGEPDSLCVWGASAGGHLALILGSNMFWTKSTPVDCAISFSGPTDIIQLSTTNQGLFYPGKPVFKLLGGPLDQNLELAKEASPTEYVSSINAKTLLLHGDEDKTISISQSNLYHEKLTKIGSKSSLVSLPGIGHVVSGTEYDNLVLLYLDSIFFGRDFAPAGEYFNSTSRR